MVKRNSLRLDDDHAVQLLGAWTSRADGAPSILERREEEFVPALLQELTGENPAQLIPTHRPRPGEGGALRLFQPIHRVFNVVLLQAQCDTFGQPRLDPRKIESSGHVIRRVRTAADGARLYDAWCLREGRPVGWTALPAPDSAEHLRDPDPARRPQPRFTADASFDRERLGIGARHDLAEETTSLFVTPPETAAATARTLLFGVMPLTSTARSGPMPRGAPAAPEDWEAHVSLLLRPASQTVSLWPAQTDAARAARLDRSDVKQHPVTLPDSSVLPAATRFVLLVQQLTQEFGLLRPPNPDTQRRLVQALNGLAVTLVDNSTRPAGDYLVAAARVYFDDSPGPAPLRPQRWPAVPATVAAEILRLLQQIASETELAVFGSQDSAGRYDDPSARYVLRAFIRVRRANGCPPTLVWSAYSEEFTIAPWFESGPGVPVPIVLPDLTPDFLRKARPNVAFSVPAKLANVLNQDPKKFLEGNAGQGSSLKLDWICGFNLPIISLCAFIVLNIFLSLLNLVFFWLPFVKICVPFPRKK